MVHRLAPEAEADLDDIWVYIACESGNTTIADRLVDTITDRFFLLAEHPRLGRSRIDLRPGMRSFLTGNYVILYRIDRADVFILRVLHGRRDIEASLRS
jgi:toxin ParE1/3/4